LYLKLYDDTMPDLRKEFGALLSRVEKALSDHGCDVVRADVCRIAGEFHKAADAFKSADVDCVVTLHLAYSPSMESAQALAGLDVPIVILDTTMDARFGRDVDPERIMVNHGIHGVMDLASVLRRMQRRFHIVAGHVDDATVMERVAGVVGAAYAARCFRSTRALRIGESFRGMGDFSVDGAVLENVLGIRVDQIAPADLARDVESVSTRDVQEELTRDRERFVCNVPEEVHTRSVRVGLGVRRRLEAGGYNAFSMNFAEFDGSTGAVDTIPFLEASKAMSRGIGYAGEGDILTAALVGALQRGLGLTTFTEIFCPDWQGDSLFLSHMGEINPDVAAEKPVVLEKPFPWTAAENPAVLTCAPCEGEAVFVNLAPGPDDSFSLVVAPVTVLGDSTVEEMKVSVRGWIRPRCPVPDFLEAYSRHGGTHHSGLVLGDRLEAVEAFADFIGVPCCTIRQGGGQR